MRIDNLKIAVVQFNPTVGALAENRDRILEKYREAAAQRVDLVVFPEMAVTGYPIEDLAASPSFVTAAHEAAQEIVDTISREYDEASRNGERTNSAGILFGCLTKIDYADGEDQIARNSALLYDPLAHVSYLTHKYELPNYGVFDEKRVFKAIDLDKIKPLKFRGAKLGVMICEDCWFPTVHEKMRSADIIIALNGSPYEIAKNVRRIHVARDRQREGALFVSGKDYDGWCQPFLYVNMVGGQDELVFDGGSFMLSSFGFKQLPFFSETIEYLDVYLGLQKTPNIEWPEPSGTASIYQACVLGLRDYMRKQGFRTAVLGMSGGVDSGIVAAIAADAIGPENVHLVRLPSNFSSSGSLTDASRAAVRLGSPIRTILIEPIVDALRAAYVSATPSTPIVNHQRDVWQKGLDGTADENIQARARGNILMAISNQEGHILLTTGNKSEVSVGYSTLYGDMAGGFNPIKDCYKTTVWDMCRYRNALTQDDITGMGFLGRVGEMVPEEIIVKPPSAELRPDQQDSDSLPPYEVLDSILRKLIEQQMSVADIMEYEPSYDLATVSRIRFLLDRAEYKRRQAAPGIKITSKLHSRERRVPIINHFSDYERTRDLSKMTPTT